MIEIGLLCQALVWLLVLGVFLATRQATLYHPLTLYLGFHGLVFVIRSWLVHYLGFDSMWRYMRIRPLETVFLLTLTVSSVALVVFALASVSFGWAKTRFESGHPEPFSVAQRRGLLLTTLLLGPLIAYSIHALNGGGMNGHHEGGTFVLT